MMKIFTKIAIVALSLGMTTAFVSCNDDDLAPTPESAATVTLQLVSATPEAAEISITTSAAQEAAYYRTTEMDYMASGEFIMQNGVQITPNSTVSLKFDYLENMTDYRVLVAAKDASGIYNVSTLDVHTPDYPTSMAIQVDSLAYSLVKASFTPDANTVSFMVGIGDEGSTAEQFLNGDLTSKTIEGNEPATITFTGLDPETNYTIYAVSYNNEGPGCEVQTTVAKTLIAPNVQIDVQCENAVVANCTITPNEQCLAYSAVVMSKELFSEFVSTYGNDPVAMLEEFTNFGMTTVGYTADPFKAELNGSCSYDYYLATLIFDLTGESYDAILFEFSSPDFVEGAPESSVEINVYDITESSARITYTMSPTTVGYYQSIFTKANYDQLFAMGETPEFGGSGEQYIIDYTAFYGYMLTADDNYVWEGLDSNTAYVAVGCPFNVNGIDGYGPLATKEFTTLAGSSTTSTNKNSQNFVQKRPAPVKLKKAFWKKEQIEAFKK